MRTDDAARELVDRLLREQPLLPMPGATQDLGMLAYAIDRQARAIERVRKVCAGAGDYVLTADVLDALDRCSDDPRRG